MSVPGKKIDLVIPFSAPALDLVVAHGDLLFPQTPVVFTAVLDEQLKSLNLKSNDSEPKRVLVILFYGEGVPWPDLIVESLRTNLASKSPYPVELNIEYADRMRYPDDAYLRKLNDLLNHKYSHPQMDVIIGLGDEAADILVQYGEALFGKIPMVLVSANPKYLKRDLLKSHMTSLLWGADFQGNVELIEELLSKTRHLFQLTLGLLTMAMLRHRKDWPGGLRRQFGLVGEVFANALARSRSEQALVQSKDFNKTTLDSLIFHIAVLDREGTILDVNESWRRFACENDATTLDRLGTGINYLEVCRRSSDSGDAFAQTALEGIQSVLTGIREQFTLEYPCDSPAEKRPV